MLKRFICWIWGHKYVEPTPAGDGVAWICDICPRCGAPLDDDKVCSANWRI